MLNHHPSTLFLDDHFNEAGDWLRPPPAHPPSRVERFFRGNLSAEYEAWRGAEAQAARRAALPPKAADRVRVAGFRARVTREAAAAWAPGAERWQALERLQPPPRLICSHRRNLALAAAKVAGAEPGAGPGGVPQPTAFARELREALAADRELMRVCQLAARTYPTYFVAYEQLADLAGVADGLMAFLGLPAEARRELAADIHAKKVAAVAMDRAAALPAEALKELQAEAQRVYSQVAAGMLQR